MTGFYINPHNLDFCHSNSCSIVVYLIVIDVLSIKTMIPSNESIYALIIACKVNKTAGEAVHTGF